MASEIQIEYGVTGRTLYAVIRNTGGEVWNGSTFETFNAANWATYDVAMTEQGGSGYYTGNFPAVAAGVYNVEVRDQAGGTPNVSPSVDAPAGAGEVQWSGTAVLPLSSLAALAAAAVWAFVTEGAFTAVQILRGVAAFVMGEASGGNTAAPVFRDLADTKDRISMTVDSNGNRTAVTRDLS